MPQFLVTASGLNLRPAPATDGNTPLAVMPRGTLYDRLDASDDGKWAHARVFLDGMTLVGWTSTGAKYSERVKDAPAGLSPERFAAGRREAYVQSILLDPDRKNFLRPATQSWDGAWMHSFVGDGGRTFRVGADWAKTKKGDLVITSPTRAGNLYSGEHATFCNFNVSYCYHEAYGGPCLQFMDGREWTANALVDELSRKWVLVTAAQAARIANAGGFVIAGKKETGHGHVVFLLGGSDEAGHPDGIRAFHVGSGEPRIRTVGGIWGAGTNLVRYVVDPATHAEWSGA
jgi:hypothetical protein